METKDSAINRAMGRQIRAEKAGMHPTEPSVAELAKQTGLSVATINRIISTEPRDINITQIAKLALAFKISAPELVSRAVERAGGLSALLAADLLDDVSDAPDTTDDLEKKRLQREFAAKTPAEIDEHRERRDTPTAAQGRDAETETDEPDPS